MRPRRSTPVASTVIIPAPDMARVIQCWRCQSVAEPSSAEYWHIGETATRLWNGIPPITIGEKRRDVIAGLLMRRVGRKVPGGYDDCSSLSADRQCKVSRRLLAIGASPTP